jgi:hypothetical protein
MAKVTIKAVPGLTTKRMTYKTTSVGDNDLFWSQSHQILYSAEEAVDNCTRRTLKPECREKALKELLENEETKIDLEACLERIN